jgi:hypothetical protein
MGCGTRLNFIVFDKTGDEMLDFNTLAEPDQRKMVKSGAPFSVRISDEVLEFARLSPAFDFKSPTEMPSTPVIFSSEGIAGLLANPSPGKRGQYLRFVVTVYGLGGKILYRSLEAGHYEASVTWPK